MGIENTGVDTETHTDTDTEDVFDMDMEDDVLSFSSPSAGGSGPLPSAEEIETILNRMSTSGRGNFVEGTAFAYGTALADGRGWGLQGLVAQVQRCYGSLNEGLRALGLSPKRSDLILTPGGKENIRATVAQVLRRQGISPLAVAWAAGAARPTCYLGRYGGKASWKLLYQVDEGAIPTGYADSPQELKERLFSGHGALVPRPKKASASATPAASTAPAASAAPAAPAAPAVDPLARLKAVKAAFEAGLISEEDFNAKKAEILASL